MTCTRCGGCGFLNVEQLPESFGAVAGRADAVLAWIAANADHDVSVCDCCGNGESWYGTPGEHYGPDDPQGPLGPYSHNGGLCQCH